MRLAYYTRIAVVAALGLFFVSCAWHAFGQEIPRRAYQYQRDLIRNTRSVWGLNAPVAVIAAQIHQESGWRTDAKSKFAAGLAQFTPATAEWIAVAFPEDVGAGQPTNPAWALRAVARYDRYLWDRLSGRDDCQHWAFTLSAYNGGPGWVTRDKKLAKENGADPEVWFGSVDNWNAGRSEEAFLENRGYPSRILTWLMPVYLAWGEGVKCVKL